MARYTFLIKEVFYVQSFINVFLFIALVSCDSSQRNLEIALSSSLKKSEIKDIFKNVNSSEKLEKHLGKDNFTFFFIVSPGEIYEGYELEFTKEASNVMERAKLISKKIQKDGTIINLNEVRNLSYESLSDKNKLGSFTVENEIFTCKILFLTDETKKGQIIKMCIPKKNQATLKSALSIFEKIN